MKNTFLVSILALCAPLTTFAADEAKSPPPAQMGQAPAGQPGDGMKGPPPLTKEARATLAGIHEKFAACVRSERTMKECSEELQAGCAAMPGGRCGGPGPGGMKGGPGGDMKKGGMRKGGGN